MKSKIISIFLSLFILFNSINFSYADNIKDDRSASATISTIYSLGKLGLQIMNVVGDALYIMDMGNYLWNSMTYEDREYYSNNVSYESDGYYIGEDVSSVVGKYVPSPSGNHIVTNIHRKFELIPYYTSGTNSIDESIFNTYKQVITLQGYTYEFLLTSRLYGGTSDRTVLYYKKEGESYENIKNSKNVTVDTGSVHTLDIYYSNVFESGAVLSYTWRYLTPSGSNNTYGSGVFYNYIPSSCSNCPHDLSIELNNKYPNKSDIDNITSYYPDLENDIPEEDQPEEDQPEEDQPEEDLVIPIPSYPNLDDFDFSGFNFESLGNLFNNFKNKFPFSIPFDIINIIESFSVDPIPPIFEIPIVDENLVIDLTYFNELANIVRMFIVVGWIFILFSFTKKLGG